jgi:hypothetical protein
LPSPGLLSITMQGIALNLILIVMILGAGGCADKLIDVDATSARQHDEFVSAAYDHFKDGLILTDINEGLDLLWRASFRNGRVYKENLALILPEGVLITPNNANTRNRARLSTYQKIIDGEKLFVIYQGRRYEVLAIIHTHPDGLPIPAPRFDFQYAFLGIHNFVISRNHIYDAFKDKKGNEIFRRIGDRTSTDMILAVLRNDAITSRWQTHYSY